MTYPPPPTGASYGPPPMAATCAFHPDRQTGLHCTRCGRPACPECLTQASVGFHCKACVAEARSSQRVARTVAGAHPHQQPLITWILIAINVAVFVVTAFQAKSLVSSDGSSWVDQGSDIPDLVAAGQLWRLLTNGFLHLSIEHIALNMISLYILGLPLERILGRWRFLTVYLLALVGGSVAVLLFSDATTPTAGASGAIFGLMGAMFVTFRRLKLDPRQLITMVVLNLVFSFAIPGISWQGHIGGLLVGAAAGALMVYPQQAVRKQWQVWGSGALLAVVLVIAGVWIAMHTSTYCSISNGYLYSCSG